MAPPSVSPAPNTSSQVSGYRETYSSIKSTGWPASSHSLGRFRWYQSASYSFSGASAASSPNAPAVAASASHGASEKRRGGAATEGSPGGMLIGRAAAVRHIAASSIATDNGV